MSERSDGRHDRQLLRIATAGSVDDGKSTLIGRLMHDTDSLPLDHLEAVTDEEGVADLAALSDGLRAEREQGITIDVAYRFFSTETRSYILADTPGHERYTRNMFTGASNAHVAILLVDARAGVLRQTRRHARIAKLLGHQALRRDGEQDRPRRLRPGAVRRGRDRTAADGGPARRRRPDGDPDRRQTRRQRGAPLGPHARGTTGPTLLEYLEGVELSAPQPEPRKLRLPVQWVSRPTAEQRRRYTGRLSAGTLQVGDPVVSAARGHPLDRHRRRHPRRRPRRRPLRRCRFRSSSPTTSTSAAATCSSAAPTTPSLPVLARELDATVCWFADTPLRAGDRVALKQGTRNGAGHRAGAALPAGPRDARRARQPGRVGAQRHRLGDAAHQLGRRRRPLRRQPRQRRVHPDRRDVQRHRRRGHHHRAARGQAGRADPQRHPLASLVAGPRLPLEATGQRGATIWFTGLPASGKSTVAVAVERALVEAGDVAYLLDGDNIRQAMSDVVAVE